MDSTRAHAFNANLANVAVSIIPHISFAHSSNSSCASRAAATNILVSGFDTRRVPHPQLFSVEIKRAMSAYAIRGRDAEANSTSLTQHYLTTTWRRGCMYHTRSCMAPRQGLGPIDHGNGRDVPMPRADYRLKASIGGRQRSPLRKLRTT